MAVYYYWMATVVYQQRVQQFSTTGHHNSYIRNKKLSMFIWLHIFSKKAPMFYVNNRVPMFYMKDGVIWSWNSLPRQKYCRIWPLACLQYTARNVYSLELRLFKRFRVHGRTTFFHVYMPPYFERRYVPFSMQKWKSPRFRKVMESYYRGKGYHYR